MKKNVIVFICSLFCICLLTSCFSTNAQTSAFIVGDKAPDFNGSDINGKPFSLSKELSQNPVIVFFYRGQWCPYCNKQMKDLQDSIKFLTKLGYKVVAISPETPENAQITVQKTGASFTILSDSGYHIMSLFHNLVDMNKDIEKYKGYKVDLVANNNNTNVQVPVPAVYVINKQGIFDYIFFNPNFRERESVHHLIELLHKKSK
ncbi:MAG: peroxiredoxin family protein [Sediminibacterium sp.]|nr:peroxiredoxin family protein [Sediminibacterium sp.]